MIAIDTNVLVYAHRPDMPWHEQARAVVRATLTGSEPVGLCWPVLHEFVAVVTNRRVFTDPTPVEAAFAQVDDWLGSPVAAVLRESSRHLATLRALAVSGRITGGGLHDARIAAICLDHGVRELLTSDRDFSRFPTLRVRNPLVD